MKRSGSADLPLHYGHVPKWLYDRMARLGGAIVEAIILDYGKSEVLRRLSDPFWFQSLGCVMGMDWHSSGITTSVMGALKKALNPKAHELGIYICGGKGKHSRKTPAEILQVADKTGVNGTELVNCSRLSAKIDNNAIQDGFQVYLHNFILTSDGEWAVVQQGLNEQQGMARRYHWHSSQLKSFSEEPHTFIYGKNVGEILNLVDREASTTRDAVLTITRQHPGSVLTEAKKLLMPSHHDVRAKDVNLKRLAAVLSLAWENPPKDFDHLMLTEGLGPRTLQSLVLVSEVIHGTPSRFSDPARFSMAHGGKDGHPFPVPANIYDNTINTLETAVSKAKLGHIEKKKALLNLYKAAARLEKDMIPDSGKFTEVIQNERRNAYRYGGKTVFGDAKPPSQQLKLF